MSWNYRVIESSEVFYPNTDSEQIQHYFRIAEVYYKEPDYEESKDVIAYLNTLQDKENYIDIKMWSSSELKVAYYETRADLFGELTLMSLAKNKPTLDEDILNKIAELRSLDDEF